MSDDSAAEISNAVINDSHYIPDEVASKTNTLSDAEVPIQSAHASSNNAVSSSSSSASLKDKKGSENSEITPTHLLQQILSGLTDPLIPEEKLEGLVERLALVASFCNEIQAYDDCRKIGRALFRIGKVDHLPSDNQENVGIQTTFALLMSNIVSVKSYSDATTWSEEWVLWRMYWTWLRSPSLAPSAQYFLLALQGAFFFSARYYPAGRTCVKQSNALYNALPDHQQSGVLQHIVSTSNAQILSNDTPYSSGVRFTREWSASQIADIARLIPRNIIQDMHKLLAWCSEVATDVKDAIIIERAAGRISISTRTSASDLRLLEQQTLFCCLSRAWRRICEKEAMGQMLPEKERQVLKLLKAFSNELAFSAFGVFNIIAARATTSAPVIDNEGTLASTLAKQLLFLHQDKCQSWRTYIARKWCQCWLWQEQDSIPSCVFEDPKLAEQVHEYTRSFAIEHFVISIPESPKQQNEAKASDHIASVALARVTRSSQASDDFAGFRANARRLSDTSLGFPKILHRPSAGLPGLSSATSSIRNMWRKSVSTSSMRSRSRISASAASLHSSLENMSISGSSLMGFSISSGKTPSLRDSAIIEVDEVSEEETTSDEEEKELFEVYGDRDSL